MENIKVRISGAPGCPLILNSAAAVDSRHNPYIIEKSRYTAKGKHKTDQDKDEIERLEYMAALYLDESKTKVVLPAFVLGAALINGAKKIKYGPKVKAGCYVSNNAVLEYPGGVKADDLFGNEEHVFRSRVRIGQQSIMKVRPIFKKWSAEFTISFNPKILDKDDVVACLQKAGELTGVGDWRPQHGRFSVAVVD